MKNIILTILGSGTLSAVMSHLLYSKKLKKDLNYRGNDSIAKEIEKSLKYTRDKVLKLRTQELFSAKEEYEQRGSQANMFGGECIYPAIFNDCDSYCKFI